MSSPTKKTSTPTKKKPEGVDLKEEEEQVKAPLTPSQRKRSEEEIILSAPASAQSATSPVDSPSNNPHSKKQKRQSEKLKQVHSPKPIGI